MYFFFFFLVYLDTLSWSADVHTYLFLLIALKCLLTVINICTAVSFWPTLACLLRGRGQLFLIHKYVLLYYDSSFSIYLLSITVFHWQKFMRNFILFLKKISAGWFGVNMFRNIWTCQTGNGTIYIQRHSNNICYTWCIGVFNIVFWMFRCGDRIPWGIRSIFGHPVVFDCNSNHCCLFSICQ